MQLNTSQHRMKSIMLCSTSTPIGIYAVGTFAIMQCMITITITNQWIASIIYYIYMLLIITVMHYIHVKCNIESPCLLSRIVKSFS